MVNSKINEEQLSKVIDDVTKDLDNGEPRHVMMYYCVGRGRIVSTSIYTALCKSERCLCADLKQAIESERLKIKEELDKTIIMSLVASMKEQMALVEENAKLFSEKGNKAAGTRARKAAQELKNLAQELRMAIQNKKNQG